MPALADYAIGQLGFHKLAVVFINGDWGRTSKDIFLKAAAERGATVTGSEGYLPNEQDFRSTLVRVRDQSPEAILLIAYYPDGAQVVRQARDLGLTQPVVATGSVYSPKFLELGGKAVDGVYTNANFFPGDPRPLVQRFVAGFRAMFGTDPGNYSARAYDAMVVATTVMQQFGTTRQDIHDGLAKVRNIPSVLYGSLTFDPATRRVSHPSSVDLVVRDGQFVVWQKQA
jgi:branched-chain amino acid transport system substrate-binding protein